MTAAHAAQSSTRRATLIRALTYTATRDRRWHDQGRLDQRPRRRLDLDLHDRRAAAAAAQRGPGRPDPRHLLGGQPVQPLLRGDPAQRRPQCVHRRRHLLRSMPRCWPTTTLPSSARSRSARRRRRCLPSWVDGGGNLIAMRPDPDLAGLLGLTDSGTDLSDAYLQFDTDRRHAGRRPGQPDDPVPRNRRSVRAGRGNCNRSRRCTRARRRRPPIPPSPLRDVGSERRTGGGLHLRPGPIGCLHAPGQPGLGRARSATASSPRSSGRTTCSSPTGSTSPRSRSRRQTSSSACSRI